jgi:hypothetical protein
VGEEVCGLLGFVALVCLGEFLLKCKLFLSGIAGGWVRLKLVQ